MNIDWSLVFSAITAIIAIVALVQTAKQTRLSNRQHLFDRRLDDFLIVKSLIGLYKENRILIEGKRKDEPQFAMHMEFIWLTNNMYMEQQAEAIMHPLQEPFHKAFLKKREELRKLAAEIKLIFKGKEAIIYSDFVTCYEMTLQKMYQYQIVINGMQEENHKCPMTLEELQRLYPEKTQRQQLYVALEQLKNAYARIEKERTEEKIRNQIVLK